jgi:hypothetical protein
MPVQPDSDFERLERLYATNTRSREVRRVERAALRWFQDIRKGRIPKDLENPTAYIPFEEFTRGKKGIYGRPIVGQMFTFRYDAKLKEKLPWWDAQPIAFILDVKEDRILSLSLHYLPVRLRLRLVGMIRATMRSKVLSREAKAQFTYAMIKTVSKYRIAKPCIKTHLLSHIKSKIVRIHPRDWLLACALPTDRFMKANRQVVWRQTLRDLHGIAR